MSRVFEYELLEMNKAIAERGKKKERERERIVSKSSQIEFHLEICPTHLFVVLLIEWNTYRGGSDDGDSSCSSVANFLTFVKTDSVEVRSHD